MAGQGAKKRTEENRKRLQTLRVLLGLGLACQLAGLVLAFRRGTWGFGSIAGFLITSAIGWTCYSTIASIAQPVFDETGEMIDGGGDLNRGGINGYSHDILYVTAFVQMATLLSSWFWYAYLTIPGYGLYKLTQHVIIPYFKAAGQPQGEPQMDAATRKKMQKAEDRAQRRRQKWS